jgi:aspartate 1-decarboxylase
LIGASGILPGEQVQIVNVNNGARFETYVIAGGKGEVCLNGAAARLAVPGDKIIVISYALFDNEEAKRSKPKVIKVNGRNVIK